VRAYAVSKRTNNMITATGMIWYNITIVLHVVTTSPIFHNPTQHAADAYGTLMIAQHLKSLQFNTANITTTLYVPTQKIQPQVQYSMKENLTPTQSYLPEWEWSTHVSKIIQRHSIAVHNTSPVIATQITSLFQLISFHGTYQTIFNK
jgi:hypothetical protein